MKVNIQKIAKRIFPIFCTLCFLISFICIPVFGYDRASSIVVANPYKEIKVVNSTADSFTVSFSAWPSDFVGVRWNFYSSSWSELDSIGHSGTSNYVFSDKSKYIFKYYPTGYNAYWDLSLIPDGTVISLYGDLSFASGCQTPNPGVAVNYYDSSFKKLGSTVYTYFGNDSFNLNNIAGDFTISKPTGAVYARFDIVYKNWAPLTASTTVTVYGGECKFTMTVPKSVLNQAGNDLSNDILASINESLKDDYGGVGNQALGEMGQATGRLNAAGQELGNVNNPDIDINVLIPSDITSDVYVKYSALISIFWSCPVLISMVGILVSLILISYVFHGKKG